MRRTIGRWLLWLIRAAEESPTTVSIRHNFRLAADDIRAIEASRGRMGGVGHLVPEITTRRPRLLRDRTKHVFLRLRQIALRIPAAPGLGRDDLA